METKETVQKDIELENIVGNVLFAGKITFAPDGSLWAISNNVMFEIDESTLDVKSEITVASGTSWSTSNTRAVPYFIHWLNDTVCIATVNDKLNVIDTQTGEFMSVNNESANLMAVSENNNVYFTSGENTKLYKVSIAFNERGQLPQSDTIVLNKFTGSANADTPLNIEKNQFGNSQTITSLYSLCTARIPDVYGYEIKESGMLVSMNENLSYSEENLKVPSLVSRNSQGAYGILFYELKPLTTYYVLPYAVYVETTADGTTGQEIVVTGTVGSFVILDN